MEAKSSLSLHRALYSLATSKTYLEDVIVEFPGLERRINQWINRISFVQNDALCSMTPKGREIYREQITNGDHMAFEHLFTLFAEMTPEQRNLIERSAEALLKGELQIIE